MIKTNFKRQGSAGLLILKGLPRNYYAEYNHTFGYLKVVKITEIPKIWNNKIFYETNTNTLLYKNYEKTVTGIENFKEIENDINNVIDEQIIIENFIESYYVGAKEGDRDILNNVDITDKTVFEVIVKCKVNLFEFFEQWNVEALKEVLRHPSKELLNKKFKDLYSTVHWYGIKGYEKQNENFLNSI